MTQRLLLMTGPVLLCVASAGYAQNLPPGGGGLLQPTYVPGQGAGYGPGAGGYGAGQGAGYGAGQGANGPGQGLAPAQGIPPVPGPAVPMPPGPQLQAAPLTPVTPWKPLTPWNPAPTTNPQAINNPKVMGDPKPFKYGYGLSKLDIVPGPPNSDIPGRYGTIQTPVDR